MHLAKYANSSRVVSLKHTGLLKWFFWEVLNLRGIEKEREEGWTCTNMVRWGDLSQRQGIPIQKSETMNHLKTLTIVFMETKVVSRDEYVWLFGQAFRKTSIEWILRRITDFLPRGGGGAQCGECGHNVPPPRRFWSTKKPVFESRFSSVWKTMHEGQSEQFSVIILKEVPLVGLHCFTLNSW